MPTEDLIFYRYDGYDSYSLKNPTEYIAVSETKCGYWIVYKHYTAGKKRWISKTSVKRFAYPTKKEALVNYIFRKRSQISHNRASIQSAINGLRAAGVTTKEVENPLKEAVIFMEEY